MISKIVIITVVILVLEFQYMVNKSWSKPADWYVLWSAFLILVSVLVAYPSYKWDVFGIIWWILSCLCCLFGSKIGEKYKIRYVKRKIGFKVGGLISYKNIVYIYFFMGILYSVILLASNGFSLFSIRKVSDLYAINNYMQAYRYSKMDINEGNIQQLCLAFTYALPICGGLLLTNGIGKKHIVKCMMCLTPNFLISVLNNTKSGIIIAVILFVAAYIIGYLLKYNHPPVLSFKIVRGMIMGLIAFMIFVFIAIRLRYNSDSTRGTTNYILITIRDYIFGCTVNFDHYFRTIKDMDLTKSYDFFAGSNILTANTFWIHKYGYVGTLIIWWLRGFLAGTAYHQIKNGCAGIIEIVILIYVYLNAIYFFTYIPFSYTTVCIGVFILFPFFLLVYREQSLRKNINE